MLARAILAAALVTVAPHAPARQPVDVHPPALPPPPVQWIVPHVRPRPAPPNLDWPVQVSGVRADVEIHDQIATTTLEITLSNPARRPQESQVVLPVPDGVTIRAMQYDGAGAEPNAVVLPRDQARQIYDGIVNQCRDPALLEFAGYNLIRSSVFPVPPGGTQKVRITYEQLLAADGSRLDYVLPRSESLEPSASAWTIDVQVTSSSPVATLYSPSHDLAVERLGPGKLHARAGGAAARPIEPGPFRLSVLREAQADGLSVGMFLYPDPEVASGDGGYFLIVAGLPSAPPSRPKVRREVTVVIDRSGSMRGEKMEQAREAAIQVLSALEDGEYFNIVDYSDSVSSFAEKPVAKDGASLAAATGYLKGLKANGGTNIHDALLEALRPGPAPGSLPIVLFTTDGLATVGERNEVRLREAVRTANSFSRRIFSFGVGFDVNAPLLSHLATTARGTVTFVLPKEDVEVKVGQVFARLSGPALTSPKLTTQAEEGFRTSAPVKDLEPAVLPDVFEGDQIVLLGAYSFKTPTAIRITGDWYGTSRTFEFTLDPARATTRHSFVPRLWATRRIGALVDHARQIGADGSVSPGDPRLKELTDEIVRLSTRYGILTEYTSFLATEPGSGNLGVPVPMASAPGAVQENLQKRAIVSRAREAGVAQGRNIAGQVSAGFELKNKWVGDDMKEVAATGTQTCNDFCVFDRAGRWVEAALLAHENEPPDKIVDFDSPEFARLLDDLILENRQGLLARGGEVYLQVKGKRVLVRLPGC